MKIETAHMPGETHSEEEKTALNKYWVDRWRNDHGPFIEHLMTETGLSRLEAMIFCLSMYTHWRLLEEKAQYEWSRKEADRRREAAEIADARYAEGLELQKRAIGMVEQVHDDVREDWKE